jgi:hypothetical protein
MVSIFCRHSSKIQTRCYSYKSAQFHQRSTSLLPTAEMPYRLICLIWPAEMVGGQEFLPIKYNQLISNHHNTRDHNRFRQMLVLKLSSIISGSNKQAIDWRWDSIHKKQLRCLTRGFRPKR